MFRTILAALIFVALSSYGSLAATVIPSKTPELEKKASSGCVEAQSYLGYYFWYNRDFTQAEIWFRKAAEHGNAEGQYRLGGLYDRGEGVKQDSSEALKWYRKAADQDYALARDRLHQMYDREEGVKQDRAEAERWKRPTPRGYRTAEKSG